MALDVSTNGFAGILPEFHGGNLVLHTYLSSSKAGNELLGKGIVDFLALFLLLLFPHVVGLPSDSAGNKFIADA